MPKLGLSHRAALTIILAALWWSWSPEQAHAGLAFGQTDTVRRIVDLDVRGTGGESLFLGYRTRTTMFGGPVYMTDEGYVVGFAGDFTRYIALSPDRIAEMQKRGQLPNPLPPYQISTLDWVMGFFLWACLLVVGGIVGAIALYSKQSSKARQSGTSANMPVTLRILATHQNRTALFFQVPALILVGGIVSFFIPWLVEVARGPQPVTLAQMLTEISKPDHRQWFEITDAQRQRLKSTRTVVSYTQQGAKNTTTYYCYVISSSQMGDPVILYEGGNPNIQGSPVLVWTSTANPMDNIYREARTELGSVPIAPFMLQQSGTGNSSARSLQVVTAIVWSIVALPILWLASNLLRTVRALLDFRRTPQIRRLQKSVRASEGIDALVAEVDRELVVSNILNKSRGPFQLPSWLISVGGPSFKLASTKDLIWFNVLTKTTKKYGRVIRTQHILTAFDRFGDTISVPVNEQSFQNALKTMWSRAPWAVAGPNDGMQAAFALTKNGHPRRFVGPHLRRLREAQVRRIDIRRAEILAGNTSSAAPIVSG